MRALAPPVGGVQANPQMDAVRRRQTRTVSEPLHGIAQPAKFRCLPTCCLSTDMDVVCHEYRTQATMTDQDMPERMQGRNKTGCPLSCCEAPTSVMDAVDLHDESATIVIVGGGPHALAALAALHEGSMASPQYGSDSQYQARVGFNSLKKVGTVCVIDPASHFNESWNARFDSLEINHLRSPAFAHPVAFEPSALLNFAIREGRTNELIDAPTCIGRWLAATDLSMSEPLLKALPSSALFRDFCSSLERKLPHVWRSGTATSVCKDEATGKFRVHYKTTADQRERKVVARAVILATGPVGKWNVPAPFEPHLASRLVLHTEEMIVSGTRTLREEITLRCPGKSARVLVIGGGISAAQAALAAYHAGHEVVLRSRRPLRTRAFDIANEWLDVRHANRLRFEFLSLPMEKRRQAVREAQSGGSVPAKYMVELCRLAEASSRMCLEVDEETDRSKVSVSPDGEHVFVNGDAFAMVILATGVVTAPSCSPLYHSAGELIDGQTVDGLPSVDTRLRWAPDEDLFVLGANAVLELGPGGGNLMGAMRGARIVSNELHDLMWKRPDDLKAGPARFANQYAALLGDESEAEGDESSSSEEEAEEINNSTAMATSKATPRPAPKKATKAEMALRKARKHRRATKGRRGMG